MPHTCNGYVLIGLVVLCVTAVIVLKMAMDKNVHLECKLPGEVCLKMKVEDRMPVIKK